MGGSEEGREGRREEGRKEGKEGGREDNFTVAWLPLVINPNPNPSRSFGKKYGNGMANRTLKLG